MMVFLCSDYEGNVQEHKIGCMNVLGGIKRWQSRHRIGGLGLRRHAAVKGIQIPLTLRQIFATPG